LLCFTTVTVALFELRQLPGAGGCLRCRVAKCLLPSAVTTHIRKDPTQPLSTEAQLPCRHSSNLPPSKDGEEALEEEGAGRPDHTDRRRSNHTLYRAGWGRPGSGCCRKALACPQHQVWAAAVLLLGCVCPACALPQQRQETLISHSMHKHQQQQQAAAGTKQCVAGGSPAAVRQQLHALTPGRPCAGLVRCCRTTATMRAL
jgi:hypothetical protein